MLIVLTRTHIEHHNIRTKSLELIMSNRSRSLDLFILCNNRFARYFFIHYDVRFQKVTLWLNKNLNLNNANNVIRIYDSRNNIDELVAINFDEMKIRSAKAPSIVLRNVLRDKISQLSIYYYSEAWSWHKIKKNRKMIDNREKRNFEKVLSRSNLEAWISFSLSIVK